MDLNSIINYKQKKHLEKRCFVFLKKLCIYKFSASLRPWMYCAFWISALRFTEGFVNCLRVCNERFVPVRSNLRLKRFSALSMFSPSFIGIISINVNLLSLELVCKYNLNYDIATIYFKIFLAITSFWISVVPSPMVQSFESL